MWKCRPIGRRLVNIFDQFLQQKHACRGKLCKAYYLIFFFLDHGKSWTSANIFEYKFINPNSIIHHQTSQKLSPKHAARGVAQSPYPIYRHGVACLSKQPPWRAAGDPRLARGRSRVRAPGPAGALRALFFSTLPSFLLRETVFFRTFPTKPTKVLGLTILLLNTCYFFFIVHKNINTQPMLSILQTCSSCLISIKHNYYFLPK